MSRGIGISYDFNPYFQEIVEWFNLCSLTNGGCQSCSILKKCVRFWDGTVAYNQELGEVDDILRRFNKLRYGL